LKKDAFKINDKLFTGVKIKFIVEKYLKGVRIEQFKKGNNQ
jgi:hypothetical protein